ncbi:unnamed protein product [Clavelina lepadiformis]|uniref:Uncharacterized protein n=2 Tax=Clavelina lepadiformis TaxID=159417 RepID=A0ABP0H2B1_CLALP
MPNMCFDVQHWDSLNNNLNQIKLEPLPARSNSATYEKRITFYPSRSYFVERDVYIESENEETDVERFYIFSETKSGKTEDEDQQILTNFPNSRKRVESPKIRFRFDVVAELDGCDGLSKAGLDDRTLMVDRADNNNSGSFNLSHSIREALSDLNNETETDKGDRFHNANENKCKPTQDCVRGNRSVKEETRRPQYVDRKQEKQLFVEVTTNSFQAQQSTEGEHGTIAELNREEESASIHLTSDNKRSQQELFVFSNQNKNDILTLECHKRSSCGLTKIVASRGPLDEVSTIPQPVITKEGAEDSVLSSRIRSEPSMVKSDRGETQKTSSKTKKENLVAKESLLDVNGLNHADYICIERSRADDCTLNKTSLSPINRLNSDNELGFENWTFSGNVESYGNVNEEFDEIGKKASHSESTLLAHDETNSSRCMIFERNYKTEKNGGNEMPTVSDLESGELVKTEDHLIGTDKSGDIIQESNACRCQPEDDLHTSDSRSIQSPNVSMEHIQDECNLSTAYQSGKHPIFSMKTIKSPKRKDIKFGLNYSANTGSAVCHGSERNLKQTFQLSDGIITGDIGFKAFSQNDKWFSDKCLRQGPTPPPSAMKKRVSLGSADKKQKVKFDLDLEIHVVPRDSFQPSPADSNLTSQDEPESYTFSDDEEEDRFSVFSGSSIKEVLDDYVPPDHLKIGSDLNNTFGKLAIRGSVTPFRVVSRDLPSDRGRSLSNLPATVPTGRRDSFDMYQIKSLLKQQAKQRALTSAIGGSLNLDSRNRYTVSGRPSTEQSASRRHVWMSDMGFVERYNANHTRLVPRYAHVQLQRQYEEWERRNRRKQRLYQGQGLSKSPSDILPPVSKPHSSNANPNLNPVADDDVNIHETTGSGEQEAMLKPKEPQWVGAEIGTNTPKQVSSHTNKKLAKSKPRNDSQSLLPRTLQAGQLGRVYRQATVPERFSNQQNHNNKSGDGTKPRPSTTDVGGRSLSQPVATKPREVLLNAQSLQHKNLKRTDRDHSHFMQLSDGARSNLKEAHQPYAGRMRNIKQNDSDSVLLNESVSYHGAFRDTSIQPDKLRKGLHSALSTVTSRSHGDTERNELYTYSSGVRRYSNINGISEKTQHRMKSKPSPAKCRSPNNPVQTFQPSVTLNSLGVTVHAPRGPFAHRHSTGSASVRKIRRYTDGAATNRRSTSNSGSMKARNYGRRSPAAEVLLYPHKDSYEKQGNIEHISRSVCNQPKLLSKEPSPIIYASKINA